MFDCSFLLLKYVYCIVVYHIIVHFDDLTQPDINGSRVAKAIVTYCNYMNCTFLWLSLATQVMFMLPRTSVVSFTSCNIMNCTLQVNL